MKSLHPILVLVLGAFFFYFTALRAIAQSPDSNKVNPELHPWIPDSIQLIMDAITQERDKADFLLLEIEKCRYAKPQLAFQLARKGQALSRTSGLEEQRAMFLLWQADISSFLNTASDQNYRQLEWAKMASEIFSRRKKQEAYVKALSLVAQITYNLSNYQQAEKLNEEVAILVRDLPESKIKYQTLANIYRLKGNLAFMSEDSLDVVLQAYKESQSNYTLAKDEFGLGLINEAFAIVHTQYNGDNIPQIIAYYQQSIEHFKKIDNTTSLASTYLELSTFYSKLYSDSKEVKWFNLANNSLKFLAETPASDQCERFYELGSNYQTRAVHLYDSLNMYSPELLDSALLAFSKGLRLVDKEVNQKCLQDLVRGASAICPYIDKVKCTRLFRLVDTTHLNILQANEEILKNAKTESENFQAELNKSEQQQLLTRSALIILILLIISASVIAVQRWRNVKAALDMRMKALRARMNPHFISNCLNAIDSLVNQERIDEASSYLISFDRLCRQILNHSNEQFITLREEIETLSNFIALEKLRLEDNLTYSLEIDDHINQDGVYIPSMLLQPFAENSIWHGIQKKQAPGTLKVIITQKEKDYLECIIEDDGIGRQKAQEMEEKSVLHRKSWGLNITEERIKALKRIKGSDLEFIDLFDDDGQAAGTRVYILLPILKVQPSHESYHS